MVDAAAAAAAAAAEADIKRRGGEPGGDRAAGNVVTAPFESINIAGIAAAWTEGSVISSANISASACTQCTITAPASNAPAAPLLACVCWWGRASIWAMTSESLLEKRPVP